MIVSVPSRTVSDCIKNLGALSYPTKFFLFVKNERLNTQAIKITSVADS